jgi:hypothetical protein
VTSLSLLEAAKPKGSEIHDAFEWDDGKAGHEYRLMQARRWIRVVRVVYDENPPERLVHVPVFSAPGEDYGDNSGYYKPASIVVQDSDEYGRALAAAKARLSSAKESINDLKDAAKRAKPALMPDFNLADRGLNMTERALGQTA